MASLVFYHSGAVYWFISLFDRGHDAKGFIFDFQVLIGSILAFIAAATVLITARASIRNERFLADKDQLHAKEIQEIEIEQENKYRKELHNSYQCYYSEIIQLIHSDAKIYLKMLAEKDPKNLYAEAIDFYDAPILKNYDHIQYFNQSQISDLHHIEHNCHTINEYLKTIREYKKSKSTEKLIPTYKKMLIDRLSMIVKDSETLEKKLVQKI